MSNKLPNLVTLAAKYTRHKALKYFATFGTDFSERRF